MHTSKNILKIISETLEREQPVNDLILALIKKNTDTASRHGDIVDYETLIIDFRYSISQITLVTHALDKAFKTQ